MSIRLGLSIALGCSVASLASEPDVKICSTQGIEALVKLGTDPEKLKTYCSGASAAPTKESQKSYDIASGKNDFAELADDVREKRAIGAKVRLTLTNDVFPKPLCSIGSTFGDKTTLHCGLANNAYVYIVALDRETRIELMKDRPEQFKLNVAGHALGIYGSSVVIEVERLAR